MRSVDEYLREYIEEYMQEVHVPKLIVALLAAWYFFGIAFTKTEWHFIDNINLIFHEAGHTLFMFFGHFLYVLGGSLFQVVFPLVFVGYFFLRREFFSSSLLFFWVGQNLINVSVYAGDAVKMQLDLLGGDGGDTSGHDWHNIFEMLGLLQYTDAISAAIYTAGILVMLAATGWAILTARKTAPVRSEW